MRNLPIWTSSPLRSGLLDALAVDVRPVQRAASRTRSRRRQPLDLGVAARDRDVVEADVALRVRPRRVSGRSRRCAGRRSPGPDHEDAEPPSTSSMSTRRRPGSGRVLRGSTGDARACGRAVGASGAPQDAQKFAPSGFGAHIGADTRPSDASPRQPSISARYAGASSSRPPRGVGHLDDAEPALAVGSPLSRSGRRPAPRSPRRPCRSAGVDVGHGLGRLDLAERPPPAPRCRPRALHEDDVAERVLRVVRDADRTRRRSDLDARPTRDPSSSGDRRARAWQRSAHRTLARRSRRQRTAADAAGVILGRARGPRRPRRARPTRG
jgi:hypothetical protein